MFNSYCVISVLGYKGCIEFLNGVININMQCPVQAWPYYYQLWKVIRPVEKFTGESIKCKSLAIV